jgi:hypothetical protein
MEMNWNEWFKFPIIVVNSDWEELERERKDKSGVEITLDTDYVIGECEVPHYDRLANIYDVFRPSEASFAKAKERIFNACTVVFEGAGSYTVPWNKDKFKREYNKFLKGIQNSSTITKISIEEMPEEMQNFLKDKINADIKREE